MLNITGPDGKVKEYKEGVTFLEIAQDYAQKYSTPIAEAICDGAGIGLQREVPHDCTVGFIPTDSLEGMRVYVRTLLYVFLMALREVKPDEEIEVMNCIGDALYCDVKGGVLLQENEIAAVKAVMHKMIADKEPIRLMYLSKKEALCAVKSDMRRDRVPLLEAAPDFACLPAYALRGDIEYFFGPLFPHAGYLKAFDLMSYHKGIMLRYPKSSALDIIPPFVDQPKLSKVYDQSEEWGNIVGCPTVAALNDFIRQGKDREIIQVAEGLQEKVISHIADRINAAGHDIHLALIAGPSSSGKTTFAQRLSVQLRVLGLRPQALSLDNYFVERTQTPRKADGEYDYECIEALDLELFHEHLSRLLQGERVKIPRYNFRTGRKEYRGQELQLDEKGVLVIEGIHGLNEKLSSVVPSKNKLKIYISALTPLSFDDYNRIQTSDMRLLRRMVRDSQFRSKDALDTLATWHTVREGEEKFIFPFAEEADVMFNTTLIYEIAALKKYAEPLLRAIPKDKPEYTEAVRLLRILEVVLPINEEAIPQNSIMREFLGCSIYKELL